MTDYQAQKLEFHEKDKLAAELELERRRFAREQDKVDKTPLDLLATGLNDADAEEVYLATLAGNREVLEAKLADWLEIDEPEAAAEPVAAGKGKGKEAAPVEEAEPSPAVEKPAPWKIINIYGDEPHFITGAAGHTEAFEYLLQTGADVNASNPACGRTALHRVAEGGHVELADMLLSRGASVNAAARDGSTPLHTAARAGHAALVERLLQQAKPNARDLTGATPLMLAAAAGALDVTLLLLDGGADLEAADENGWTALLHAAAAVKAGEAMAVAIELARRGANRELTTQGGCSLETIHPLLISALPPVVPPVEEVEITP